MPHNALSLDGWQRTRGSHMDRFMNEWQTLIVIIDVRTNECMNE